MRTLLLFLILCLVTVLPLQAQPAWTLRQCIDYAIAHSVVVQQKDNNRRQQELSLSTARNSRLPDLNASASENFSFGRAQTLDGTYSNNNTNNTSFSLGTSVPLFTGFEIPNTVKMNQLNLEAATQDLEKAKNDIRIQVAQAYVQILYDMEIADVAHRQIAIDSQQVARLQGFFEHGKASATELSQQQATLAQARLTAVKADNQQQLSLLALAQLLELPTPQGFSIVRPQGQLSTAHAPLASPETIYAEALAFKPEVQAEQLRLRAAERNIKIAEAGHYPTLTLNGGLQTNYYKTNGLLAESFADQMRHNFAQYIGLSLNVPIFNRFRVRNNVRLAHIEHENQQLLLNNVKKTLYKEIQQVYYNTVAARSKYESSQETVQSSRDAFLLTQAKYENGKATITEFNEAKNNYLKAESELVQARYELLYQHSLMDFYQGKELDF